MQLLAQQFKSGNLVLRIRGPRADGDNLFAWESGVGGSAVNAPTLHLVAVPGHYVIITNTPPPRNVLTAAAGFPGKEIVANRHAAPFCCIGADRTRRHEIGRDGRMAI